MILDDLDRLLAQWKGRIDAAAAGLGELRSRSAYDILAGSQKLHLTGMTAEKLAAPVAALDRVWTDYDMLCVTVQRATELRRQISRFTISPEKVREIELILTGPAISLGESAAPDLISTGVRHFMTLDQLVGRINAAFVAGRDALTEIDSSWTKLNAQLGPVVAFLDEQRTESACGIQELRTAADAIRPRVISDPLGAMAEFDKNVAPVYNRVRSAIVKLQSQRKNLRGDLATARRLAQSLPELHAQSERVFNEFREKIAGRAATEPALDSERIKELEARLAEIETRCDSTDIDPVCTELEHCICDIKDLIAGEERALARNRAPLELRRELRGRLSALKAKAVAHHRSEDPKLAALAHRANDLLYKRPTPIDEAATLVAEYGRASL